MLKLARYQARGRISANQKNMKIICNKYMEQQKLAMEQQKLAQEWLSCQDETTQAIITTLIDKAVKEERERIYSFSEDRLIGIDNDLLGDLSNIIFDKKI